MAKLVLIRHGLSEWNKLGLWTGWENPSLTEEGKTQARESGRTIKDIKFDYAYSSDLLRATQTMDEVLKELGTPDLPVIIAPETKEKNYGIFTKKNKWQVKDEVGETEFQKIRRSWDYQPKEGESLKMVSDRFWNYYQNEILPKLKENKNILMTGSGNAFRSLIKVLEDLTEEEIANIEFGIGEVYIYDIDHDGKVLKKEIRAKNEQAGKI
jgi:2,3-bisphosphoglycerate-dependent phosphoglycerate mutase